MFNGKRRRQFDPKVNAGSMADIAFLLLIFFLVTTTIMEDSGIRVKLPEWTDRPVEMEIPEQNILSVLINSGDDILVEEQKTEVSSIKEKAKAFIMNPDNLKTLPSDPRSAIISLQNDRSTSYQKYVEVYNEIKAAYNELWEEAAQLRFRKSYIELNEVDRVDIRKDIPLVISEAEPTDANREG